MSTAHSLTFLSAALTICLLALLAGARLTAPGLGDWYRGLAKPGFTPPNWAFPAIWPALFLLMAIAWWRTAVAAGGPLTGTGWPASLAFLVQLALNVGWSAVFFALRRVGWALLAAALLALSVAVCAGLFWRLSPLAGGLMLPYLAWTCFAVALNLRIWQLNR